MSDVMGTTSAMGKLTSDCRWDDFNAGTRMTKCAIELANNHAATAMKGVLGL